MRDYEPDFRMPRYAEIPDVGLYLEQVVKYVNDKLEIFNLPITTSMISNYVKKGYIERLKKIPEFYEFLQKKGAILNGAY